MKDNIQQLEDELLGMLLGGNDPVLATLRRQLESAKRKPRELTGAGFFTYFDVPETAPRLQGNPSFSFGGVKAEIEGLQHGAGFVLFVRNGILSFLEGYSFDEPWPPFIESYK